MTKPAAFRATYSDLKLIKTRQCVQIVFELPLADFDAAYNVLGGMPNPANETWFGIAPLKPGKEAMPDISPERVTDARLEPNNPPARAKLDWRDVQPAAQAGIRCAEPNFRAFLREVKGYDLVVTEQAAAVVIREICEVNSRTEFGTDHRKRVLWHQLDTEYQAWKALERA